MRSTKPGNSIILFAILSLSPVFADLGPNSDELGRALYDESYICVKLTKAVPGLDFGESLQLTGMRSLDNLFMIHGVESIRPRFKLNTDRSQPGLPDLSRIYLLEISPATDMQDLITSLGSDFHVEYAEPVCVNYFDAIPNDSLYTEMYHLPQIQAEDAWDIHKGEDGSEPIVVGIVDSGIDWRHPDLLENIHQNLGEDADGDGHVLELVDGEWVFDPGDENGVDDDLNGYVDDFIGWNVYADGTGAQNNDPDDPGIHGTHVAGLTSAVTNNAEGVAAVSWNVELMTTSHGYTGGGNHIYSGYQGIIYLAENGADIINNSWGGGMFTQAASEVLQYAQGLGSIIIASAGNGGGNFRHYPSDYPGVVSVASVGSDDYIASYSNFGAGVDISSVGGAYGIGVLSTLPDGAYGMLSGTSMAGPLAAGSLALLKSYQPDWTNEELIYQFLATTDDIYNIHDPYYDHLIGTGRINAYRQLTEESPVLSDDLRLIIHEIESHPVDLNTHELIPGDSVDVHLTLRNFAVFTGDSSVSFTMTSNSAHVEISPASVTGSIPADGFVTLSDAFNLVISPESPAHEVVLTLGIAPETAEIALGSELSFTVVVNPAFIEEPILQIETDWGTTGMGNITLVNSGIADIDFEITTHDMFPQEGQWHLNTFMAFDGVSWYCGDDYIHAYSRWHGQILELPVLDLSEAVNPVFSMMAQWDIENPSVSPPWDGWDGANIWISIDGGLHYEPMKPDFPAYTCESIYAFEMYFEGDSIPGWAGNSGGWVPVQIDLSDYLHERVLLRVVLASDPAQDGIGFFMDDILIADGEEVLYENDGVADFKLKNTSSSWFEYESTWLYPELTGGTVPANSSVTIPVNAETADLTLGGYVNQLSVTTASGLPIGTIDAELYVDSPPTELGLRHFSLSNNDYRVAEHEELRIVVDNYGGNDIENFTLAASLQLDTEMIWSDTLSIESLPSLAFQEYAFEPYFVAVEGDLDLDIQILDIQDDAVLFNNSLSEELEVETILDRFYIYTNDFWDYGDWGFTDMSGYQDGQSMHCYAGVTPYPPNANTSLTFLPGVEVGLMESFAIKYYTMLDLEQYADFGYFEISFDQENWIQLNQHTGTDIMWRSHTVDLTEYCGGDHERLWFRFRFSSDAQNEELGFFVDHVLFRIPEIVSNKQALQLPEQYLLHQNFPNPFNPSTTLRYELPEAAEVKLLIFDINGREVRTLVHGSQPAGLYDVVWDGGDQAGHQLGTGLYFCQMQAGDFSHTIKMLLME